MTTFELISIVALIVSLAAAAVILILLQRIKTLENQTAPDMPPDLHEVLLHFYEENGIEFTGDPEDLMELLFPLAALYTPVPESES